MTEKPKDFIPFNHAFIVGVEVENDPAEVAEMQRYFTDNKIDWYFDFDESGKLGPACIFYYHCTLQQARIIYLSIRSIGVTAIKTDMMNKQMNERMNRNSQK